MNQCNSKAAFRMRRAHAALRVGIYLISFLLSGPSAISCLAQQGNSGQRSMSDQFALSTDSVGPRRFVAVHGRRSIIMGYPETGLEVWAYPLQILSDYRIGFRSQGATSETDGRRLLRRIIYRPDSVTRVYIGRITSFARHSSPRLRKLALFSGTKWRGSRLILKFTSRRFSTLCGRERLAGNLPSGIRNCRATSYPNQRINFPQALRLLKSSLTILQSIARCGLLESSRFLSDRI